MPDDRADDRVQSASQDVSDTSVAVAGVLYVGPMPYARSGQAAANAVNRANGASGATAANGIWVGPAAGWRAPRGIHQWERELSFVPRASMTAALASALRATLPAEQIAPKRFPMAAKAVEASPLLGISSNLDRKSTRLNSSHLGISYAV